MKCEICGNEIPEGYKYCPNCGDPVFDVDLTENPIDTKEDKLREELKKNREKLQKSEKKMAKKINIRNAIIISVALLLGFIIVYSNYADSSCFYKDYTIKRTKVSDVEEPSLTFTEGMFFASNGDVLQNRFTRKLEITDISYNEDHTKAVFLRGEECYYIDGRLKPKKLTAKSNKAVMSKRGTKAYFNNLKEGCVCVYDSASGKIEKIADEGTMERSCVSADGNTIALFRPEDKSISIITSDKAPSRIVSGLKNLSAIGVSDDGQRVFYRTYNNGIYAYYFYNNMKTTTVSTGYYLRECINYDVTEFIAFYQGALYFNSEMESGVTISDNTITSVVVRGPATAWVEGYSTYYVKADSFEPSLIKDENGEVYYLPDHNSDCYIVDVPGLGNEETRLIEPEMNSVIWCQDGELGVYTFYKDDIKYTAIDAINEKEVYNYSYNDDISVIWFNTYEGDLYLYNNGTCEKVMDGVNGDLEYDKDEEKTFFIKDKNLYSVRDSMDSMKLEMEGCRSFGFSFAFNDYLVLIGDDGNHYAYIFGNLVKED